jgi:hypothetical protein
LTPLAQDQIVLDLAIGAGGQALVSGDKDLLVLAETIGIPGSWSLRCFKAGWSRNQLEHRKAAWIRRCSQEAICLE